MANWELIEAGMTWPGTVSTLIALEELGYNCDQMKQGLKSTFGFYPKNQLTTLIFDDGTRFKYEI